VNHLYLWWAVSAIGFILSSIGGLGSELLDRFAGRSLEAYCRLKKNRDRFGAVLDHQDDAIDGSGYLRMMGTVIFLIAGTGAIFIDQVSPPPIRLMVWGVGAVGMMMMVHVWLPAAVTRFASTPVLYHSWPFWRSLSIVMSPLSAPGQLIEMVTRRLMGTAENEDEDEEQLEDEIRTMVTAGTREGYFGPGVREMIQGVVTLHENTVSHIMTSRSEVDAIDVTWDWDKILKQVVKAGRTRFPVYKETLDQIVGVLYVKDLLPYLADSGNGDSGNSASGIKVAGTKVAGTKASGIRGQQLVDVMRRPWNVADSRSVESMLREFLHSRSHMAIVLDEFGQTAGVVTIEDALEEIVGEIVDESDAEEEFGVEVIDDETVEVDGRVMIDDLNEMLDWGLPESEDYETVAGYVLYHTGAIPDEGHKLTIEEIEIEILRASNRKIESMRIHRSGQPNQKVG
jgi:CBS domain containing-hemolysin-like protein